MCMFYFWFYFTFLFVGVLFSFIFCCWGGGLLTSLHPLPNIQYRKGALLCFDLLLYSVVDVWRGGISARLTACPAGAWPLRWPVGSHVTAWRGNTSQSLFGLFVCGMIKALPTQDLREYVTAARERFLSSFCLSLKRLLSPSSESSV